MSKEEFWAYKRAVIEPLIERCGVLVAANPDHLDQVYGWCCAEVREDGRRVLHGIYVRHPFRGFKVATELLNRTLPGWEEGMFHTHPSIAMERGLSRKWGSKYAPNLVREA